MSDYQQIPGNIRSFLATTTQTWTDRTAELAASYAALCEEANQRLRRCADYLGRGMGSAAIHLADCQPNLMQSVAWLQFPERQAWANLCVANGNPAPAMLEVDCLAKLKDAYEREKSLQPLLSRHRLLAIAKAPPRARLEVVRMLAAAEGPTPAWSEEIDSLELLRLDELAVETKAALRDGNEAAIQALFDEVSAANWRQHVPLEILGKLQAAVAEAKIRRSLADLPAVAGEVLAAFDADPPSDALDAAIQRWNDSVRIEGLVVPTDLKLRVQPALDWAAARDVRKSELEDVRPFQHLFEPALEVNAPAKAVPEKSKRRAVALFFVVAGLIVAGSYNLHIHPHWMTRLQRLLYR